MPFHRSHSSNFAVHFPEVTIAIVAFQQTKILLHLGRSHLRLTSGASTQNQGAGGHGTEPHTVGKIEQLRDFSEIVEHLCEKNRNSLAEPTLHEPSNATQSPAKGAITPHKIVSSASNSVQAYLYHQSRKVQFSQDRHLFFRQEHSIGLQHDSFKTE
jgi:hypothetical protein